MAHLRRGWERYLRPSGLSRRALGLRTGSRANSLSWRCRSTMRATKGAFSGYRSTAPPVFEARPAADSLEWLALPAKTRNVEQSYGGRSTPR